MLLLHNKISDDLTEFKIDCYFDRDINQLEHSVISEIFVINLGSVTPLFFL